MCGRWCDSFVPFVPHGRSKKDYADLEEYNVTLGQKKHKVTLKYPYGNEIDITGQLTFEVDNKDIAFIDENGIIKPLGLGQTTAKIRYDKKLMEVLVKVSEITAVDEEKPADNINEPKSPEASNMKDVVLKLAIVLVVLSALITAIVIYRKKMESYDE